MTARSAHLAAARDPVPRQVRRAGGGPDERECGGERPQASSAAASTGTD
ncbi:MAG: hypothetical protein ABWY11_07620 [Umezawaea sp.]